MNHALIFTQIRARLNSDNVAGGLVYVPSPLIESIGWAIGPESDALNSYPNLTMNFVSVDHSNDGFDADVLLWSFDVHAWVPANMGTLDTVGAIMERIYGDAMLQTNNIPEYGLHRHNFNTTLTGGWKLRDCSRVGSAELHERDVYHAVDTYQVLLSR